MSQKSVTGRVQSVR